HSSVRTVPKSDSLRTGFFGAGAVVMPGADGTFSTGPVVGGVCGAGRIGGGCGAGGAGTGGGFSPPRAGAGNRSSGFISVGAGRFDFSASIVVGSDGASFSGGTADMTLGSDGARPSFVSGKLALGVTGVGMARSRSTNDAVRCFWWSTAR